MANGLLALEALCDNTPSVSRGLVYVRHPLRKTAIVHQPPYAPTHLSASYKCGNFVNCVPREIEINL
jgi:hypothetical protein